MKFRYRLLISYFILILLPLLLLGTLFYQTSLRVVTDQAQKNVYEIVKKNNELLNTNLKQIDSASRTLFVDKDLFRIFNTLNPNRQDQLLEADRQVTAILGKYFSQNDNVYFAQLWTTYYTFGLQRTWPQGDPTQSRIYQEAEKSAGKMIWYPTYDFAEMFNQPWMASAKDYDYRYLFSATRLLNFSHLDNSTIVNLDSHVERPVLTISLKADIFREMFERSIPSGSYYFVISPTGAVIAHSDAMLVTKNFTESWVQPLFTKSSGTQKIKLNGKNMIVCFDRSEITNWLSVIVIPESALIGDLVPTLLTSTLALAIVLGLIALILAFFISGRITGPIKKLLVAMRIVGEGDFQTRVEATSNDEFGILIRKFNDMNNRIHLLVNENYEIKLKEKEAEIQALNLQMNPHFLYNTLNVMNWLAIENNQKELSKMLVCLSNMLHYTTRKDWNNVHLIEELDWMKNYFYIMSSRFEGKFAVQYEIQASLYNYKVPRLLFQPFVENAILHGFDQMEDGGLIIISGWLENDIRFYEIKDNGRGMTENMIQNILNKEASSVGIKNTIGRVQLRYGEQYGVSFRSLPDIGTTVLISLPLNYQE
jgi:two-component system sensor histidine kinase YesM